MPSIGLRKLRRLPGRTSEYNIKSDKTQLWLAVVLLTWPTIIYTTKIKLATKNDNGQLDRNSEEGVKDTFDDPEAKLEALFAFGQKLRGESNVTFERTLEINQTPYKDAELRRINAAISDGIKNLEDLIRVKEPFWYEQGLTLNRNEPAAKVAQFGSPRNKKAILLTRFGFAALEASMKIAESSPANSGRQLSDFSDAAQIRLDLEECPLRGRPRCPPASKRYRTADGTCNNFDHPWRGSAMFPMQRFIAPVYEDGLQSIRRSVFGDALPSARQISKLIHVEQDRELHSVTLMLMQFGQFIDHDITSTVKMRSFNESTPRCCGDGGRTFLHPDFLHPSCLPIEVPPTDPSLSRFGVQCIEFTRSAPSTRINCELGWREQMNQVTSFIDASTIYGSDVATSDSLRTFRDGLLFYGRRLGNGPLNPPDPPGGEICREGAVSEQCFQPGDGRVTENVALVAMHTIFVRYHNKVASILARINPHWSDEKVYQETRKIVSSVIQHITYREFLPIVVGPEVMDLFELRLLKKGYYRKYDKRVNPTVSNSFSTAAYRFGHSLVQNSFVRTDRHHIPLFDNVTIHEEFTNVQNIWTRGSVDRLLLGLSNQRAQQRDEFISSELTEHLFQFNSPFGMDLAAINIQRGRDHGIPPYTYWRKPCGLPPITKWKDLEVVMSVSTVIRLRTIYRHVDDIDLFTGGLSEKPLKGGVTGPTFACIIAQQFSVLRRGDRFWYENGDMESSFTPAQLEEIRKVSLAQVLCQTMREVETIQPFVFLSPDDLKNSRIHCSDPALRTFDLAPWEDTDSIFEFNSISDNLVPFEGRSQRRRRRDTKSNKKTKTTTRKPKHNVTTKKTKTNITDKIQAKYDLPQRVSTKKPSGQYYHLQNSDNDDVTYLLGILPERTTKPTVTASNPSVQVNINIQYAPLQTETAEKDRPYKNKRPTSTYTDGGISFGTGRPVTKPTRPNVSYPTFIYAQSYDRPDIYSSSSSTGHKRPNLNGVSKPINSLYRPSTDFTTTDTYNDKFNMKPLYFETDNYYNRRTTKRPTVFEHRPFSSSNTPQHYDLDSDDDSDTVIISKNKRRPQDKTDLSDDIVDEFFDNQRDITSTDRKKIITAADIDDKLDFTSRLNDGRPGQIYNKEFVHVSSVKKQEAFGRVKRNDFRFNMPNNDDKADELMEISELPTNYPCSYILPKPMNEYFPAVYNEESTEKSRH